VIVLAIHSTTQCLAAALVRDGNVLAEEVRPPAREHAESLAVMVKGLIEDLGMTVRDLDGLGVAMGPGSFSGIRVGLATVKGMGLVLGKPVAGISSLEILAWEGLRQGESGASVIDARRGEIYVCLYKKEGDGLDLLDGPVLTAADGLELLKWPGTDRLVICGDPATERLAESSNIPHRTVSGCSASACGELTLKRLHNGDWDDLHALVPLYVRRSDAEEKKNGRKSG
jgi:tRNA threonylcarbamoyladenosine biosynthesis protein TsaB